MIVLNCDVISSRQITNKDRISFFKRIDSFNEEIINDPDFYSDISLVLGDTLLLVLREGVNLLEIIRKLRRVCYPLRIRIGIGIGDIEDFEKNRKSDRMFGQAFYDARSAVTIIESSKLMKELPISYIEILTAIITLLGIINVVSIDEFYLRGLYTILLVELIGAVIGLYKNTKFFGGK